ncbi:MAG: 3-deoxy-7-phosphoheptulonate synthase [Deltaproteobacteria bacterium HGW-Deltaproteobacteria-14]|jgi:3-deoxy-7-phosphoheptulonate synthase|nr:MAG: 3-deoxy-7-phosphoheptulonate synthase [Deltaproteobacteria bacterium HGW-Deltaproteobacteria-14]
MTTVLHLHAGADPAAVKAALQGLGVDGVVARGAGATVVVLGPVSRPLPAAALADLPGVAAVLGGASPHPRLDALAWTAVAVGPSGLAIGPGAPRVLIAGPCAAESRAQVDEAAAQAAAAGAKVLRGGAYKPRTSPYAFDGVGPDALGWLRDAADRHGLALVTEALSERDVARVAEVADLVQIGSRQMQAFALLRAVGQSAKPALLKRGRAATLAEWRLAGEHLLAAGAPGVVFCERGILGAETELRNTFDLAGAVVLRCSMGLPVVADPSHAAGRRDVIAPLARAAWAAGLDGVIVESHPDARHALSDGVQALSPAELAALGRALGTATQEEER